MIQPFGDSAKAASKPIEHLGTRLEVQEGHHVNIQCR